jgi:hypothetical protein
MKYATTRLEEPSDQEGCMLKCHSVEKELIQPTLPEDLKL